MKAPNITPGPWTVEQLTTFPFFERGTLAIQPDIACLQVPELDSAAEANAKAIAALPQLLNALARLESAVSNHQLAGITIASLDELCDAQDQAREALRTAGYTD